MKTVAIIGGGLAGSFLAAELVEGGACVLLFDAPKADSATRVAAGMFNVVTGRKLTPTWMAGPLLAALHNFFNRPAYASLRRCFHLMPLYRRFATAAESEQWPAVAHPFARPAGDRLYVPNVGRLDTGAFVEALAVFLEQSGGLKFYPEYVHAEQIDFGQKTLHIAGDILLWDALVFCEGVGLCENPLFPPAWIRPLKGQLLHVVSPDMATDHILVWPQGFLAPVDRHHILGATYEHHFIDAGPTPEGAALLLAALEKQSPSLQIEVIRHLSGLRPTTADRRPIVGPHPDLRDVFVFNGLGAKGVLQAPYFAAQLARRILTPGM